MPQRCRAALVLTITASSACQHPKTIGPEEARSEIRSAASLASESLMFITYIRDGHATRQYAECHAAYLEKEAQRSEHDFATAVPGPRTAEAVRECRTQLRALQAELSGIPGAIDHPLALADSGKRIERIRENLTEANSFR